MPENRAVYFQYNMVADAPRETLARFSERLGSTLEEGPADTLIIDLRRNRGGNNYLNRALLRALIRNPKLQRTGSLLVLVGRTTFSAAMMFAVDLEKHTPALFVGEPTGASPNGYGDSRKVVLPHTGLTVRVSTLHWQYSEPRDKRPWIAPHIPVDVSSQDETEGRDPVLQTALSIARARASYPSPTAGGNWKGRLTFPFETVDYSLALEPGGGPWRAATTIGHPAFEPAAVESVSVEGRRVSFVLKTPNTRFEGSGTVAGDWLLGDLLQSDQTVARFALRRAGH